MRNFQRKSTVRYFLIVIALLFFLFVSGDFGLIDVQKTAIVMAVGVDREEDNFIVTSQIAVPKASNQGKSGETVQLVSRGKTVADAFEEINAKTGWYPKLVFCKLLLLGESATQNNVFEALDFFLLDEYLSDNCLVAACEGSAQALLNVQPIVDASGSIAIQKVLSAHAQRVGTTLPATLREFSIGYFSDSKSGFLPLLKTQPQQETNPAPTQQGGEEKPVFSARETALFYAGKRVGTLSAAETFAFNAVKNKLRLATYSLSTKTAAYTLTIKRNSTKISCKLGENGAPVYKINLTMTAGLLDSAKAFEKTDGIDVGDTPKLVFESAEKLLSSQITSAFDKARTLGSDIFGVNEGVRKRNRRFSPDESALKQAVLDISVTFQGVR